MTKNHTQRPSAATASRNLSGANDRIVALLFENAKLKEALEEINSAPITMEAAPLRRIARAALKGDK